MDDFEVNVDDLAFPARLTLNTIDNYITIMYTSDKDMRITELDLHHDRWDELETSLKWNTRGDDGCSSLKTHTYRGVKIVKKVWDE